MFGRYKYCRRIKSNETKKTVRADTKERPERPCGISNQKAIGSACKNDD